MKELKHLNLMATVGETATIAQSAVEATEDAAIDDAYLNGENNSLKTKVATMITGIGVGKGKEFRQELHDADILRDDLLSALILILKGYIKWNKPATAEAAVSLLRVIDNHGKGIINLSIEKESAKLDSILNIFDQAENVAAFATLTLSELHAELKAAQANLKTIYQQSAETESEKAAIVSPSAVRRETQKQLNKLIDYLNTMVDVNEAKYGVLASKMAQFIDDLNKKIKVRNSNSQSVVEEVSNN